MMWGYYDGWSWIWMAAIMAVVWTGTIALVAFAIRVYAAPKDNDQAMQLLRQRLASGEIDMDEFERTRKALQS